MQRLFVPLSCRHCNSRAKHRSKQVSAAKIFAVELFQSFEYHDAQMIYLDDTYDL